MNKYGAAVTRLRKLILFLVENSITVPETEFTSNLGEWLVMDQLTKQGYSPTLQSGQNDVDILLPDGEEIEVKSGKWDSDFGGVYRFDRIKPKKLDYLICVQIINGYSEAEYFVFSEKDVEQLPPRNQAAFNNPDKTNNQRLLRILDKPEETNRKNMRVINRRLDDFHDAWHKLPSAA